MKTPSLFTSLLCALSLTAHGTVILIDNTSDSADHGGHLITVSGGDLFKPNISSALNGSIGSNGSDNNTWGTGSTAAATGDDIGSTWRLAATTKIGSILNVDPSDDFNTFIDLAQPLSITVQLKVNSTGSGNQPGYVPLGHLYGVDTAASGTSGWWATADMATQDVAAGTLLTPGVFNAGNDTWTFSFTAPAGLVSADNGDILGVAIVGNRDAVANESISFAESTGGNTDTFFDIVAVPEPGVAGLLALGALLLRFTRLR